MSTTDFEHNDALDGLSSEELEERAFGPTRERKPLWNRRIRVGRRRPSVSAAVSARPASVARPALETTFCYACGEPSAADLRDCPACGVRQPRVPRRRGRIVRRGDRPGESNKAVATLLAAVLGGVGAHRFYLGQWKTGLAMLLLCWTFLPALVGVVDALRYLFMSDLEFAERYDGAAALPPPRPAGRLPETGAAGAEEDPVVLMVR